LSRSARLAATAATLAAALVLGPSGIPAPAENLSQTEPPVVRITTEIVQVDAVVTDHDGHPVTGLTAGDFEIREDGRRQEITHCSYVDLGGAPRPTATPAPLLATERPGSPQRVRRTMAFVVDDLSLSIESTVRVRRLLTAFVDEQMEPGDAVAIIRVSAGMGALQQFTADKRLLHAAIQAVRFSIARRLNPVFDLLPPVLTNGATEGPLVAAQNAARGSEGNARGGARAWAEELDHKVEERRAVLSSAGTLGALHFILRGVRELPGRKSIVLVSENLSLEEEGIHGPVRSALLTESLQRATDAANRSSVVIYSLDPTGLQPGPLGAGTAGNLDKARAGLSMLARDTGGLLLADTNDLGGAVARVVEDQRGYYLIGYAPDDATFRNAAGRDRYHRIDIEVKRPGLMVRSRAGFYSRPDANTAPRPTSPQAQVIEAVMSPFVSPDIHLRLTPLFGHEGRRGSYLRSLLHIDARDLTLTQPDDGGPRAGNIRLSAMAFDAAGRIAGQTHRNDTIAVAADSLDQVRRDGFVYVLDMPIGKGAYQVRAAVRDESSGRTGSASQFVEVPDASKGRLALSGIILTSGEELRVSPAVRRFPPGVTIAYSLFAYNPRVDAKTGVSALDLGLELFRDGTAVESPLPRRLEGPSPEGSSAQAIAGTFRLPPEAASGSYSLGVTVRDRLHKGAVARQWIDFEVADQAAEGWAPEARNARPGSESDSTRPWCSIASRR
jgi:VWFA-related protein